MDDPNLSQLQRRLLGSLPAWTSDEQAVVDEEGGPAASERSHSLAEVHANLHEPHHPYLAIAGAQSVAAVEEQLHELERLGYAEHVEHAEVAGITHHDVGRMTELGLQALTWVNPRSLEPAAEGEQKTPAEIPLQTAISDSAARAS